MNLLRTIRDRLEGLLLLLLAPGWFALALAARVGGRLRGWHRLPDAGRRARRRWRGYLRNGLRTWRETWWVHLQFEMPRQLLHHVWWTEFFSACNQAGLPPPAGERYLIIKLAHFGDALHVGPMIRQLHAARPGAEIDVLVGPWCADLARRWPGVRQVFTYVPHLFLFHRGQPKGLRRGLAEGLLLSRLRRRRYTTVFSTSTLNMCEWMLIQAAHPRRWIGADAEITGGFADSEACVEPYAHRLYEAERVSGLLRHLGLTPAVEPPFFTLAPEEEAFAAARLAELGGNAAGPVVALAPGAGWPGKIWPVERMGEVAKRLREEQGARIVVLGSAAERNLADEVARVAGAPILNLAGRTTLGQAAAVIRQARLFVGNDSGPLHFAACFDTPSLALFGPTIASKWAPRGPRHRHLQKGYSCMGCVSWHPAAACQHDGACMKLIEVDDVVAQATELLREPAAGTKGSL